ncbi:hypothetical protein Tco_0080379 [Tanacetum coccineum]
MTGKTENLGNFKATVFDREDLDAIYKLVMDIYQDKIPEGFDKVLWGYLIVMFTPDEQVEFGTHNMMESSQLEAA